MADARLSRLYEAEMINAAAWLTTRVVRAPDETKWTLELLFAAAAHVAPACPFVQAVLDAVEALQASVAANGWDRATIARMELSEALSRFFQFRMGQAQAARQAMGEAA